MISIIVVGYNSKEDLKSCFDSVFKSSYKQFRVIFVDNGSSDNSVEFVRTKYPSVIVILNKNSGYPGGNNVGIKHALKMKSEYVFLLNPDVTIDKGCLETLSNKANKETIVQPLILLSTNQKKTDLINTTGDYLNFLGFCYCDNYRQKQEVVKEKDIIISSGAAVLIPSQILEKIGLFDENFFMYHEDADFSYRAHLYGYNIKLIPQALAWHRYSFSKNKNKMFYAERNRFLFLYKNFSTKYLILIMPILIVNEILLIIYALFSGWFWQKLRALPSALLLIKSSADQKKKNLPHIKTKEKKLKRFIGAEISFGEIRNPLFAPYNLVLKAYWFLIRPFI